MVLYTQNNNREEKVIYVGAYHWGANIEYDEPAISPLGGKRLGL